MNGNADGLPKTSRRRSRVPTLRSVRGCRVMLWKIARLRARVNSSSEPPSTYSKEKFGSRRRASSRRSSMLCARR